MEGQLQMESPEKSCSVKYYFEHKHTQIHKHTHTHIHTPMRGNVCAENTFERFDFIMPNDSTGPRTTASSY